MNGNGRDDYECAQLLARQSKYCPYGDKYYSPECNGQL